MQHGVAPGNSFIPAMRHCFSNGSGANQGRPRGRLFFMGKELADGADTRPWEGGSLYVAFNFFCGKIGLGMILSSQYHTTLPTA